MLKVLFNNSNKIVIKILSLCRKMCIKMQLFSSFLGGAGEGADSEA